MRNLLRADFYKLRRSKAFWLCIVAMVGLISMTAWTLRLALDMDARNATASGMSIVTVSSGDELPADAVVYPTTAYTEEIAVNFIGSAEIIALLFAIFAGVFIGMEYGTGTMKTMVGRGLGRLAIYCSRQLILLGAILFFLLVSVLASCIGAVVFGIGLVDVQTIGHILPLVLRTLPLYWAYASVFMMASDLVRNSGAAIAIGISIVAFTNALLTALNYLFAYFKIDLIAHDYWLPRNIQVMADISSSAHDISRAMIVAAVVFIVTTAIGILAFRKRDIS